MENEYVLSYLENGVEQNEPQSDKKLLSGYILFCKENRTELQNSNPGLSATEISKLLGERWKLLNAEERSVYTDAAKEDSATFKKNNEDNHYKKSNKHKKVAKIDKHHEDHEFGAKCMKIEMIPSIHPNKNNARLMWLGARTLVQALVESQQIVDDISNWVRNSVMETNGDIMTIYQANSENDAHTHNNERPEPIGYA